MQLCECGCGQPTSLARQTDRHLGYIKGQPVRFILGHCGHRPVAPRFWARIEKAEDPDGCWLWTGTLHHGGYGLIRVDGRQESAHRVAWEMENGPIPDGMMICHRCDVKRCVRNDGEHSHLFLGTAADNMHDMARKGRAAKGERHVWHSHPERVPRGERNSQAVLTAEQVQEIRETYARGGVSQRVLAARYGVTRGALGPILRGRAWRHLL